MRNPVFLSDGHSYEKEFIEQWLQHKRTSPLTGLKLQNDIMVPNFALKSLIDEFLQKHPEQLYNDNSVYLPEQLINDAKMSIIQNNSSQLRNSLKKDIRLLWTPLINDQCAFEMIVDNKNKELCKVLMEYFHDQIKQLKQLKQNDFNKSKKDFEEISKKLIQEQKLRENLQEQLEQSKQLMEMIKIQYKESKALEQNQSQILDNQQEQDQKLVQILKQIQKNQIYQNQISNLLKIKDSQNLKNDLSSDDDIIEQKVSDEIADSQKMLELKGTYSIDEKLQSLLIPDTTDHSHLQELSQIFRDIKIVAISQFEKNIQDIGINIIMKNLLSFKLLRQLTLCLSNNQITCEGASYIGGKIFLLKNLEQLFLNLNCNQIQDSGCKSVVTGISLINNLSELFLDLSDNLINEEVKQTAYKQIKVKKSTIL